MKRTQLLLILFLGITTYSNAYITKQRDNGFLGLYRDISETKIYDIVAKEDHYSLTCENPGLNRCRFQVLTDAHLVVNGTTISGEAIENYFSIAENLIEAGTLSGTSITPNGVVIHWYGSDVNNNTIGLYNIQEAVSLGILPANYGN